VNLRQGDNPFSIFRAAATHLPNPLGGFFEPLSERSGLIDHSQKMTNAAMRFIDSEGLHQSLADVI